MARPVTLTTTVATEDAVKMFQQSMRVSWWSENMGAGTKFSSPSSDEFEGLKSDPPSRSVVALLGGGGHETQASAVILHVWEREGHREIVLAQQRDIAAFGVKAKMKIKRFVTAMETADPSMSRVGG